jgi:hypothetical protein
MQSTAKSNALSLYLKLSRKANPEVPVLQNMVGMRKQSPKLASGLISRNSFAGTAERKLRRATIPAA